LKISLLQNKLLILMKNISYYNNSVTSGYYDIVFERKKGVQCAWHHIKFFYIKEKIGK